MSAVEFTALQMGYWQEEIWGDKTWTEGCGPKGEVGIFVNAIYNVSDKKIKKIFFYCVPYDASGKPVGKEARCECLNISSPENGRFDEADDDGLVDDNIEEAGVWECLWCAPTAQYAEITKVQVIYADGGKEEIDGKDIKYIDDKGSLYYKIIKEKEAAEEKAEQESRKAEKKSRTAEAETRKAEEESKKAEEEKRSTEDRKTRGIVAWGGITDPDACFVEQIGDVTFYFEKEILDNRAVNRGRIVGWESTREVDCLEAPAGSRYVAKDCMKGISTLVCPRDKETCFVDRFVSSGAKKIVVPKEATRVVAMMRSTSVHEVEFEDPFGWGIKKDILCDPKKTYEYIRKAINLKKSAAKAVLERLFRG